MKDRVALTFFINGRKVVEESPDPETTLLTYIRKKLRLTGSKLGCGEGGCGACTVMVSKWDKIEKSVRHFAVNACLASVVSVHKCAVTTVEGIGSTKTKLHQVQERLAAHHGSQCGFCTPGFVMSMYTLLRNNMAPTFKEMETCLQGNLCRCTGYRSIISAFQTFTCDRGEQCCKNQQSKEISNGNCSPTLNPYDTTQEPIFPPTLRVDHDGIPDSVTFAGKNVTWYQPADLRELLFLKTSKPDAKIVVGNTEIGIEMNVIGRSYAHLIHPVNVRELFEITETATGIMIGASCSLSKLENCLLQLCAKKSQESVQTFEAILKMLKVFAGAQIRNVACLGGNIMTGSPISDLNPILMACGAKLTFESLNGGRREIVMDDTFFSGYRRTIAKPEEVLISISLPFLSQDDIMEAYKQSKRKEDDIAIVNSAMLVTFNPGTSVVKKMSMAFGGMAAVTKMAKKTMDKAVGRMWDKTLLNNVCQWLNDEMELALSAPGGMVEYRRTLVTSFFFKFYHHTFARLVERNVVGENNVILSKAICQHLSVEDQPFTSERTWQEPQPDHAGTDTVGHSVPHTSGLKQVTGEAEYLDDITPIEGELNMVLVYSTRAHAKIISVDAKAALQLPGVVDFISVNDVMGENVMDGEDENTFADGIVTCYGHVIGGIVADTQENAFKATGLVSIEYEDLEPAIITIEDAIEHDSYYAIMKLAKGDIGDGFKHCDHVTDGEVRVGGQDHFYLETHCCIAIPRDGESEMEVWSSTQDVTALQKTISTCLGVPRNRVLVKVKRIGGGFGGKESRASKVACPAAIAAKKLGRPVRCVLTRQHDMLSTGGRHPFLGRYKIGYNNDGRIKALEIRYYNNAGNTLDLSESVMEKAVLQSDNSYEIPNMEITGHVCRTHIVSNTAFRGFGSPQSNVIVEDWITRVAYHLDMSPEKIRYQNMLKNGDTVIYGAAMFGITLRDCWEECVRRSDFERHRREVNEFNAINRWKKRGISCVASKFTVGFGLPQLEQSGALVLVYTDGSVLLSHGGMEMGQGLYTKTIQIASKVLGIPTDSIHIMETSTATVPNTSATAASLGTDLNGMAVKNACEIIVERLKPLRIANPNITWRCLVEKAYENRINLSAFGHYKSPEAAHLGTTWDRKTGKNYGEWSMYQTCASAAAIVEIDVLTGHHAILRADIVIDVGRSINPALDIGQVEGAFTQGVGLMTMEEPLHSGSGRLLTVGPGSYKIPALSDTPRQFNIHFFRDSPNEVGVYSARAVGEPPLLLGTSVFCAIKDGIKSARAESGISGPFRLDSPATCERIRNACQDNFTKLAGITNEQTQGRGSWSVRT